MMDITAMTSAVEPDAAAYNAFVAGLELAGIELVKIGGERIAAGVSSQVRFDLTAGYLQDENGINYRYDASACITDEVGADLGRASASVVIAFRTAVSAEVICIERFGGISGAFIAHPYLREAIASTAQRLGFPGVLLPMITSQPDEPVASVKDAAENAVADAHPQVVTTSEG
jgi:hypothetical protein